jgi:cytochrome b subunit of formate dehydrogenase
VARRGEPVKDTFVRFSLRQRIEHTSVMTLFILLAVTGFPQKFSHAGWAQLVVRAMGGVESARMIHRGAGILFAILTAVHLGTAVVLVLTGKARPSMIPGRKDFADAIKTLRYYLGLSEAEARFDRFDYRQKFEYWGLVMGGLLMVGTGFVLYVPLIVTAFLPGVVIPIAKVAHIYNAHLNPDVFPFDFTIFNGKISRHRMEHEHPLELARLSGGKPPARHADAKDA